MAAITSNTQSWNTHLFSEVETYIKNYYSLTSHTHDYSNTYAAKSHTHSYLPLSGGTMTGILKLTQGVGIESSDGQGLLVYRPTNWTGISSTQWGIGAAIPGVIRSDDNALIHCRLSGGSANYYEIIDSKGGQTISDSLRVASLVFERTNEINGYNNENIHLNYRNSGNVSLGVGGGFVGIGASNPGYKLDVEGTCRIKSGIIVSGRPYGSGDDEGIVVNKASNGYAGITLGTHNGLHTTLYLNSSDEATWVYNNGNGTAYTIKHPKSDGTIALTNGFKTINGQSIVGSGNIDVSGGGGGGGSYVPIGGGTMTGDLQVNALITAYNYTNSRDAAAIKFDKPSSNWTGIGAHAIADTIFFCACDGTGGWVTSYTQKWLFNGDVTANGGVNSLSDKRHKKIVGNTNITVEDIASMSSVLFRWNDGRNDDSVHVGSIAQDWESVLPQVVNRSEDEEGTLSLNYGVAALVSTITTARSVVNLNERVKELETEVKSLKDEIKTLKGE